MIGDKRTTHPPQADEPLLDPGKHLSLLETCVEHLNDIVMIAERSDAPDGEPRILYVNQAFERRTGFTRAQAIGRSPKLLQGGRTQRDALDRITAALDRGESAREELIQYTRDGLPYWVETEIVPVIVSPGEPTRWIAIQRDVTERKAAELKLQGQLARTALLNRITRAIADRLGLDSIFDVVVTQVEARLPVSFCAIAVVDPNGASITIKAMGGQTRAMATYTGLSEQLQLPLADDLLTRCAAGQLVSDSDLTDNADALALRLVHAGQCSAVLAPLRVEDHVFGLIITARDAAQGFDADDIDFLRQLGEQVALAARQAQLHDALHRAYDDLRRSQQTVSRQERLRAVGQMASGVAHDINNAMSPVTLYLESLLEHEPGLSTQARDRLQAIQHAIDDVAHTVARMRDLYRPQDGDAVEASTDVNAVVQRVIEMTRPRWRDLAQRAGADIQMRTDLQPDLPSMAMLDGEIQDAVTNLVLNAVDAMPRGGMLTLRTHASASADGSCWLNVMVADTGVGMDDATRQRCMEPFFTTKGTRGTGLGLSIVHGIVERHAGQVGIHSAPGRGTSVHLRFPISPNTSAASDAVVAEGMMSSHALRVLVVDDDEAVRQALTAILEAEGHAVDSMPGGRSGIDAFVRAAADRRPHDVVITDLGMPEVDGRSVALAVKQANPRTSVLMLTGWGERIREESGPPDCVDQVISKPPRLAELRAALARCRPLRDRGRDPAEG